MRCPIVIAAASLLAPLATASTGRDGHGLIGYGITMYKPLCAYACQASISNPLNCTNDHTTHDDMHDMVMVKRMAGMHMENPTPECTANNEPYLQTLAYCMSQRCTGVPVSKLEWFFEMAIGGRMKVPPVPMWTYGAALASIGTPPTTYTDAEEMLTSVSLVADEDYESSANGNGNFEVAETRHSRYSIILIVATVGVPILASFLARFPASEKLASRLSAALDYLPLIGRRHATPLYGLTNMPTRRQSLFLAYLIAINIILMAVGYNSAQPNSWFSSGRQEIASYISNRAGSLSYVNLALAVLFAGRNNPLLWLTDLPHATCLVYHRWIAAIAALQACLHSAMYLQSYLAAGAHSSESKMPYWIWGIVATLGMTILLPTSILPVRKKAYELFLVWHIVIAFFTILGGYYHMYLRFERQWGYEVWLYIAFAFWAWDRVMRAVRLLYSGWRKATVTALDEDYIRLDIAGVTGEGQAYLYFPDLTWRVWENHPFSIASGLAYPANQVSTTASSIASSPSSEENEKHLTTATVTPHTTAHTTTTPTKSLTFLIRTHSGLTSKLRQRSSLPVLVETYSHSPVYPLTKDLANHPRLLCIAGGVGITALLPLLASHPGQRTLYWGARSQHLIDGAADVLDGPALKGVEVHTRVGERWDVRDVLEREAKRSESGLAVVVSGPDGMSDEVRAVCGELAARGVGVRFWSESYSW